MDTGALTDGRLQTRIQFRAEGRFYAEIVNDRWLRCPCRDKRCQQANGPHRDHYWDRLTGQRIPEHRMPEPFRRRGED